jgi:peptide/nickel transport system permease protein
MSSTNSVKNLSEPVSKQPSARRFMGMIRLPATLLDKMQDTGIWIILSLAILVTAVAIFGNRLAPHDPIQPVVTPYERIGSADAILGSDNLGRDLLSRVLIGVRVSWLMALLVVIVGLVIGGIVGLVAGFFAGWIDNFLMRITDMFLALPPTLVAIAVVAALGAGLRNTFIAITVVWWPYYARIIRGEVHRIMALPFVESARMSGIPKWRVMLRHVLPGVLPTAVTTASLDIGAVILTLANLSFLGLGTPAPAPELGSDTARGMVELLSHWWIPVVPGIAVMILSLIGNLTGEAVRKLLQRER